MPVNSFLETDEVIETHQVAKDTFISVLRSEKVAPLVSAGQFVMISFPDCPDPLLPRAFSVCDAHEGSLSILFVAVGRATRMMSKLRPGDHLVVNGPLGRGFPEMERGEKVWAVLGGSGAALIPILAGASRKTGSDLQFFYGARSKHLLAPFSEFKNVQHATDDGSEGFHGNVVDLVKQKLKQDSPSRIFGCGPTPMLAAMQREFGGKIPTYLSVETPMACGMGFCQGCPVRKNGESDYHLACKDGPVFESTKIVFEVHR